MKSHALRRILTAVLPHVGGDITLPVINAVLIEQVGTYVTATATDRYTLAHCRIALDEGESGLIGAESVVVPLRSVRMILTMFCNARENTDVKLNVDEQGWLTVQRETAGFGLPALTATFVTVDGTYPAYRKLLAPAKETRPAPFGVGLNGAYLARFQVAGTSAEPLIVRQQGPNKMVLVTAGVDFIGAQMPVCGAPETAGDPLPAWLDFFGTAPVVADLAS